MRKANKFSLQGVSKGNPTLRKANKGVYLSAFRKTSWVIPSRYIKPIVNKYAVFTLQIGDHRWQPHIRSDGRVEIPWEVQKELKLRVGHPTKLTVIPNKFTGMRIQRWKQFQWIKTRAKDKEKEKYAGRGLYEQVIVNIYGLQLLSDKKFFLKTFWMWNKAFFKQWTNNFRIFGFTFILEHSEYGEFYYASVDTDSLAILKKEYEYYFRELIKKALSYGDKVAILRVDMRAKIYKKYTRTNNQKNQIPQRGVTKNIKPKAKSSAKTLDLLTI